MVMISTLQSVLFVLCHRNFLFINKMTGQSFSLVTNTLNFMESPANKLVPVITDVIAAINHCSHTSLAFILFLEVNKTKTRSLSCHQETRMFSIQMLFIQSSTSFYNNNSYKQTGFC